MKKPASTVRARHKDSAPRKHGRPSRQETAEGLQKERAERTDKEQLKKLDEGGPDGKPYAATKERAKLKARIKEGAKK